MSRPLAWVSTTAFLTGLAGLMLGTGVAGPVLFVHGAVGFAAAALALTRAVASWRERRGVPRVPWLVAAVVAAVAVAGVLHSWGMWVGRGDYAALTVHIALAVAGLVGAACGGFVIAWRRRRARRTAGVEPTEAERAVPDDGRRRLLTGMAVAGGALVVRAASEPVLDAAGLAGGDRRFTGSFETGSFDADGFPTTEWFNDEAPTPDVTAWRLDIATHGGRTSWTYDQLAAYDDRVRATIDCTGAWYSTQDWEGVRLDRLLGPGRGRSIHVRSATGYWRAFPRSDADHLYVALRISGQALSVGHGFPARLVAPGRRGFWWVKWVDEIALSDLPWWWQPPLPLR